MSISSDDLLFARRRPSYYGRKQWSVWLTSIRSTKLTVIFLMFSMSSTFHLYIFVFPLYLGEQNKFRWGILTFCFSFCTTTKDKNTVNTDQS